MTLLPVLSACSKNRTGLLLRLISLLPVAWLIINHTMCRVEVKSENKTGRLLQAGRSTPALTPRGSSNVCVAAKVFPQTFDLLVVIGVFVTDASFAVIVILETAGIFDQAVDGVAMDVNIVPAVTFVLLVNVVLLLVGQLFPGVGQDNAVANVHEEVAAGQLATMRNKVAVEEIRAADFRDERGVGFGDLIVFRLVQADDLGVDRQSVNVGRFGFVDHGFGSLLRCVVF